MSLAANVDTVSPTPTDEELVAITAALELAWPRPVMLVAGPVRSSPPSNWRFSGRWWNNHPLAGRPRP